MSIYYLGKKKDIGVLTLIIIAIVNEQNISFCYDIKTLFF